ncbi:MAG: LPS export ABC transporter permease LptF [Rhodoferax sp.]|nr:LPS export ABC transporter permease LptF [Rhodoferax sp.]
MLFHSSLRKEMSRTFGATVVLLATIVITMLLIRTLNLATRGSVNPTEIIVVLGYTFLVHAPTILTLSLFISIVATLSRMYRDSEMVIWFSAGQGLGSFVKPLFRFVWPMLLMIAAFALFGRPWANQQQNVLRDRFEHRNDLERVAPGQFQESAGGNRVFFIDKDSIDGKSAGEVFIAANERGKETITTARAGVIDSVAGDRFLMLSRGQRLERSLENPGTKISEFEQYGVLMDEKAEQANLVIPVRTMASVDLIRGRTSAQLGELSFRLGIALAAVNFVLIALVVSGTNPRVGRNGNLLQSLLTFVVYSNLVTLGSSRIASGTSSFLAFTLALHGGVLVASLAMLAKLHWNWTVVGSLRSRRRPALANRVET